METKVIATKFVSHDIPELETLKSSKAYQLREKLNKGERLSHAVKRPAFSLDRILDPNVLVSLITDY